MLKIKFSIKNVPMQVSLFFAVTELRAGKSVKKQIQKKSIKNQHVKRCF